MQTALSSGDVKVVIVEGFTIIHDESIARLCDQIFFLDVGKDITIMRRSAQHEHNSNPLSQDDCENVLWPAHERYVAHAEGNVLPTVGKAWIKLDANDNGMEMLDSHVKARADIIYATCFGSTSAAE